MIEYDERNSHISSELLIISTFSNNDEHHVTKNLTSFHPTALHSASLNLSTLQFFPFILLPTTLHLDIRGSFVVKYLNFSTLTL